MSRSLRQVRMFCSRLVVPSLSAVLPALILMIAPLPAFSADATESVLPAQTSWWFQLRSTGYIYQTEDQQAVSQDRFRVFQHFSGALSGLAKGRVTFRASGRFADDLELNEAVTDRSRLYTGYLEARLATQLRARVGRQFIQEGVTGLTLDGAWFTLRSNPSWDVTLWGGARAPYGHRFDLGKFDENAAVGGRIGMKPHRNWRLHFSGAYRERAGGIAERPVGVEFFTTSIPNVRAFGRAAYDLEREGWGRLEAQAQWTPAPDRPIISFQLLNRYPAIDAMSYFSRFTGVERIQLARTSIRYELESRFGGEIEYLGAYIDERNSQRFGIALLIPGGRIGYSLRAGDAGEENSFYGDISYQVLPWLWLDGQATYLTYALLEDAPEDNERELSTFAGRLRAELRPGVRFTAEVQGLENPFYSEDVRFLVGLDIAMARGNSRFGLDRGGWLR